jgi:superfamily II DNA or RNA helicase
MGRALSLRPHQRESIEKLYAAYGEGYRRAAIVLPCGAGKSYVMGNVAADAVANGQRVLLLAHRTELIEQNAEEVRGVTEGLRVGILQGRTRQFGADVLVASVQTAVQPLALRDLAAIGFGIVMIDECHHSSANSYQTILKALKVYESDGPLLLGVTATLDRADGKRLGDTFETVAHTVSAQELIDAGFLLPPRGVRVRVEGLDLTKIKKSRTSESGLDDKAVAAAMHDSLAPAAIARAVLEHASGRQGVAFLPSVELSKEQAQVFRDHGLSSVHVDADTPRALRKEIVRRARLGEYDVVCNVGLFTEGTNIPIWSFAAMARPTSSSVLYQQMAWRPGRPHPGQRDFVVLDTVGVTRRHGLQGLVNLEGAEIPEDLDEDMLQFDDPEAVEPEREPGTAPPVPPGSDGELEAEMFDLFGRSHAAWKRSPGGLWYLPAGDDRAVVLRPGLDDLFDVMWSTGEPLHDAPCDLSTAMAWGEQHAGEQAAAAPGWRAAPLRPRDAVMAAYMGGESAFRDAGAYADVRSADWARKVVDRPNR